MKITIPENSPLYVIQKDCKYEGNIYDFLYEQKSITKTQRKALRKFSENKGLTDNDKDCLLLFHRKYNVPCLIKGIGKDCMDEKDYIKMRVNWIEKKELDISSFDKWKLFKSITREDHGKLGLEYHELEKDSVSNYLYEECTNICLEIHKKYPDKIRNYFEKEKEGRMNTNAGWYIAGTGKEGRDLICKLGYKVKMDDLNCAIGLAGRWGNRGAVSWIWKQKGDRKLDPVELRYGFEKACLKCSVSFIKFFYETVKEELTFEMVECGFDEAFGDGYTTPIHIGTCDYLLRADKRLHCLSKSELLRCVNCMKKYHSNYDDVIEWLNGLDFLAD